MLSTFGLGFPWMYCPKEQRSHSTQPSWYKRLGTETFGALVISQLSSAGHGYGSASCPLCCCTDGTNQGVSEASSACQWHFYINCGSRATESQLWDEPFLHLGIHSKPHQAKVCATSKHRDHTVPHRGLCPHERCLWAQGTWPGNTHPSQAQHAATTHLQKFVFWAWNRPDTNHRIV